MLESANKGTLFLDEIGELPLELQTKLLQVIQTKSFMRVGGRERIQLDARFVAATNQDLEKMVQQGTFRLDLYYRLSVVPVTIPPLRERQEDLLEMLFLFLHRINTKYNFQKVLSPSVIEHLLAYNWPGNVRELENVLERTALTTDGNAIYPEALADPIRTEKSQRIGATLAHEDFITSLIHHSNLPLDEMLLAVEREILGHYYKEMGSTRKMAKRLHSSQSTITRKLQRHGMLMQK